MSGRLLIGRSAAWSALLLATLGVPVVAAEAPVAARQEATVQRSRTASAPPAPRRAPGLFPQEQIIFRSRAQLQFLTAAHQSPGGLPGLDPEILGDMSHSVRQSAQQAGRSVLRGYLRSTVDLSTPAALSRGHALGADGRLRVQADLRHGLPELELHYRLSHGALKAGVTLDGSAGVWYRDDRMTRARVSAGFDGNDTWQVQVRFGF